jgi:hypothetical protein
MRATTMAAMGLFMAAPFLAPLASPLDAQETNPTHAHLGHVADGWRDTPEGMGFLPTAVAEARVAAQHAGFAARDLENLDGMKRHADHVLHAVDTERMAEGPGHGYGVKRAAEGVIAHLGMAMDHQETTGNIRTHGNHVVTSTRNTLERVERIAALVERIQAAGTAAEAAPLVQELDLLATQLIEGEDLDGNGQVSWQEGEGGLAQAEQHMELLLRGEGLREGPR